MPAPDDSPGFLFWRASLHWQHAIAAALAPLDLTHAQFVLLAGLWWLDGRGERPNQLRLARHSGTDVKMTSQVVRRLEDKGLLTRVTDPGDTRAKRLGITPAGARLATEAVAAVEAADAAFFGAVPDRAALLAVLRPLAAEE
ncbi:MarR family transcriptional regulator [Streptomyces sp. H10-C2]|uniref:MarR family winged helix-turn-helix transcriptional regulator n=1 Tax=unclassified Streptomyces TaxID=2593676 RepID=UPI0024B8FE60|nr:MULTISPECIES: MarR family transcriptional regulator [unclassified Streptomyces]MDJ0344643.1 MarR family transcriptional regulator [Streptomyces sp. PH10-H1]MDJ0373197.1 MarR family transcriptional regulator [Streptomyces sp. H10-C2]